MLKWWRRRRDRRIVAWLRSPEGRKYIAERRGSESDEVLEVSVIDVMDRMLEEDES